MGCDIHQKLFAFSKIENKMVPVTSIISDGESKFFPQIVGDRDYNLFGMFGNSARSFYPEMDCFEGEGWPDFIKDMSIYKQIDISDYHTRRWCKLKNLKKSLIEYRERLTDPNKFKEYYDSEDDFLMDAVEGKISKEDFASFHRDAISSIDETLKSIENTEDYIKDMSDIVDENEIVLVTWMDS